MWSKYPSSHPERKYDGVCLWYQIRLVQDDVYKERECKDFFERIPDMTAIDHFDYKVKRDNLGDAYATAKRSKNLAWFGVVTSLVSIGLAILRLFS